MRNVPYQTIPCGGCGDTFRTFHDGAENPTCRKCLSPGVPSGVSVRRVVPYFEPQLGIWIHSHGHLQRELDRRGLFSLEACGIRHAEDMADTSARKRPVGTRREFLKAYREIMENPEYAEPA